MRRLLLLAAGAALLIAPARLVAQQWTPAQQKVIDDLRTCWDLWMTGVRQGSPDPWINECTVEGQTYWVAQYGSPVDIDWVRRSWDEIAETDLGWLAIHPITVRVIDDVAVMHFYGYWRVDTPNGPELIEGKRTEVFKNVNGRWRMMAGHQTQVGG